MFKLRQTDCGAGVSKLTLIIVENIRCPKNVTTLAEKAMPVSRAGLLFQCGQLRATLGTVVVRIKSADRPDRGNEERSQNDRNDDFWMARSQEEDRQSTNGKQQHKQPKTPEK